MIFKREEKMLFHDFLRALMEAWGHKPKGTTVWELLKEVWQNLPFGVKKQLVEIVPEQSFTGTYEEYEGVGSYYIWWSQNNLSLELDYKITYTMKFNGVTYTANPYQGKLGNLSILGEGEDTGEPFACNGSGLFWKKELGETVTFSIGYEQEVTTPILSKFVSTVFYVEDATVGVDGPAQLINADGSNVTFEQAKEAGDNVVIFDKTYSYYYRPLYRQESGNVMVYVVMGGSTFTVKDSANIDRYVPHMCYCLAGVPGGGVE